MEDALVPTVCENSGIFKACLNPCFNGRCTRTNQGGYWRKQDFVLILVLMEDALVQEATGGNKIFGQVLILVLMEDALVRIV